MADLIPSENKSYDDTDIIAVADLIFEENVLLSDDIMCDRYGCTCIAFEKCCGCLIQ